MAGNLQPSQLDRYLYSAYGTAPTHSYAALFLKHQLIWIPIVGLAFWALEFPFMRRFSREQIANNPKLATVDWNPLSACAAKLAMPLSLF